MIEDLSFDVHGAKIPPNGIDLLSSQSPFHVANFLSRNSSFSALIKLSQAIPCNYLPEYLPQLILEPSFQKIRFNKTEHFSYRIVLLG